MKRKNIIKKGVPIVGIPLDECIFCKSSNRKRGISKFPVCIAPVNTYSYFRLNRWIVNCADTEKECKFYVTQLKEKYKKDLRLMEKYILRYRKNKVWLKISYVHMMWLYKKLSKGNFFYIKALLRFYGFEEYKTDVLEDDYYLFKRIV